MKKSILATMLVGALAFGGVILGSAQNAQADFGFFFGQPREHHRQHRWFHHEPRSGVSVWLGGRPTYYYREPYYCERVYYPSRHRMVPDDHDHALINGRVYSY